ncbi:MAG: alpha/beta fold hydrolase [Prosthecobacter sp.]|nr:alpha/beta fold hydrolase [Prosthecobacter sp.]
MWKRRWLRWSSWATALLLVAGLGLSWRAASELSSPTRRPIQDYHREFLGNAASHGVRLQAWTLKDGTPCLMAEPGAALSLGPRGVRIRDQLAAKGLKLPPVGEIIGTLVLLHGRNGRKEDYLLIAERLCAAGFRCLIPDLPGHGDHPEALTRYGVAEAGLPGQVLAEAAANYGFAAQPAGLLGMSMGGSVALHGAAKEPAPWKALVIISSFDALQPVILRQATNRSGPWLGGLWAETTRWAYESRTGLPLSQIQPAALAGSLRLPTLIAHGTDDQVIAIEAGRRLYDALPAGLEKQWVEIPGADHHNVLITDFPIYATIAEWMLRHLAPGA